MATIVLQVAGAYLGGVFGTIGATLGTAAGAVAGYLLDTALLQGSRHQEGPRLTGARPFTAEEGASIPRVYGTVRVGGTLIWATRFEETGTTTRQGAKGGARVTEYSYFANMAFALCEGEISGIRRVWADGREINRSLVELRVYEGTRGQAIDPLIEARQGAGNAPAYRDTAYVVIEHFAVGDYGNRVPQFQFEVIRAVGKVGRGIRAVAMIPGSTEFGLDPRASTRQLQPGETANLNRHVLHGPTDFTASLDELQMLCPNLEHVGLVVTWFGDDLRAGQCPIRPKVTENASAGFSPLWSASGLFRLNAPVVSYHDGGAAYGGSPADGSVVEAIREIKRRGLKVTLYPFVMMDVPAGNALPDPYGAAAQAPYPWRGRITCHPGPGRPGSADRSSAARDQVAAFCGNAAPGDFVSFLEIMFFAGDPDDWGYRRFILHFAHLAAVAGGVDAFLVGSELRGLTTLRDGAGSFPFVEALCELAGDVKGILGAATKITYGADWTEYFGHHPQDGSGDAIFHLDPLWSHPAIDAIGIDNYMPLSDWRDVDVDGGNPDGFASPYDRDGLMASIASGEGFDWYYPNEAARRARARSAIADDAHGKPWVFRYKDIVSWWSNPHHDRPGGVENGSATGWVAQSKPIWFTEIGCPAVDKGPNQPNVFPDPKSSESATPYFSGGGRSDLAQMRLIEAHQQHWDPGSPYFAAPANPMSVSYPGRMLDVSRTYVWAWDARPFPAFPLMGSVWRDGGNWSRGHWLNGRLSSVSCSDLIDAILADYGLAPADTTEVDGMVHGYIITDPMSPRSALEPLIDIFGLAASIDQDGLTFGRATASGTGAINVDELVVDGDRPVTEIARSPDSQLPTEATMMFRDPLAEYQAATVRTTRPGSVGQRQESISFPGVLEASEAAGLLDHRFQRKWGQRERISFELPPNAVDVVPGAIVSVAGVAGEYLVGETEEGLVRKVSGQRVGRGSPRPASRSTETPSMPPPTLFGPPLGVFLDLPLVPGASDPFTQFRAAAWSKPWKTQLLLASPGSSGFVQRAQLGRPATIGELLEPLGPGFEGRFDKAASILVRLVHGELAAVSRLQLLNGANAAAIATMDGTWEVVQFEAAEEVAPSTWRLRVLLRGQLGTGDAMQAGAEVGARFVLLNEAVQPAGLAPSEAGLSINWRLGPSGHDLSTFSETTQVGGLRARMPLSPVHLRSRRTAGGYTFSWIRRSRVGGDDWMAPEVPLGEEREEYWIEIAPAAGTAVREAIATAPSWHYPAAAIAADFPTLPASVDVSVRQLSASVGWGIAGTARFTLA